MKKLASIIGASLCLIFASQSAFAEPEYELSVSHIFTTIHPVGKYIIELTKEIEQKSNNRIAFHVYDNNTLFKGENALDAVQKGGVDIANVLPCFVAGDLPYSHTHDMPFLSSDALSASRLMWAMLELPEVKQETERYGEVLFAFSGAQPGLLSTNTPIRTPSDLKGKRVLVLQASFIDDVKEWGGIPVQISVGDAYVALQRGMGEVLYTAIPMMPSMKLQELGKYLTPMPTALTGNWWFINKDIMEELPEDLRTLLRENTGAKATEELGTALRDSCLNDIETLRSAGVEIIELSPEEITPWKDGSIQATKTYYRDVLTRGGEKDPDAWMSRVRELASRIEAEYGAR